MAAAQCALPSMPREVLLYFARNILVCYKEQSQYDCPLAEWSMSVTRKRNFTRIRWDMINNLRVCESILWHKKKKKKPKQFSPRILFPFVWPSCIITFRILFRVDHINVNDFIPLINIKCAHILLFYWQSFAKNYVFRSHQVIYFVFLYNIIYISPFIYTYIYNW